MLNVLGQAKDLQVLHRRKLVFATQDDHLSIFFANEVLSLRLLQQCKRLIDTLVQLIESGHIILHAYSRNACDPWENCLGLEKLS